MKKFVRNTLFRIPFIRDIARGAFEKYTLRAFAAAQSGRLLADWNTAIASINADIRSGMSAVRDRARDLWRNNDYVRGYRQRNRTNIIGPEGFSFQSRVKNSEGELDEKTNMIIEEAWRDWGRKENCTMNERFTFRELCMVMIDQIKRDGEVLLRKVYDESKKYLFALEPIESDYLDHTYNEQLRNGNTVIMGVELNQWRKPVAYWFIEGKVSDEINSLYSLGVTRVGNKRRIRIPAEDIIHYYDYEHAHQYRGYSHLTQSMITFKTQQGYDEAALFAARLGAARTGFYVSQAGQLAGVMTGDEEDDTGEFIDYLTFGEMSQLPRGWDVKFNDPNYPHEQYAPFTKQILRRMATGLGLAYANWVGDLEAVNFSSMRSGLQDERDQWMLQQANFREGILIPIFEEWLKSALINKNLPFSYGEYARLNKPEFVGRRWDWVDPRADVEAIEKALNNNLTSLTIELGKKGIDFNELVRLRKKELKALAELEEMKKEINNETENNVNNKGNGKSYLKNFIKVQ